MKISKRLREIALLVDKDKKVIDVGCDHGLLSIYLTLYNNNNCIATDINQNALNNAVNNIKKYNLEKKIKTLLSDGLDNIEIEKNTNIIISGMGANTIINILKNKDLINVDSLIIQSNNDLELLRKELVKIGFFIKDEIAIKDKNKFYVIIKFIKGYKKYNSFDYYYGPIKKNNEYNYYLINKNIDILNKIPNKYILKKIKIKKIIKKLRHLL